VTAPDPSMGSNGAVGVLAISRDDEWAHAYEDERSAVAETAFGRSGQSPGDIDFFDGSGRALTPVYGSDGVLTGLETGSSEADPEAVRQRLRAVLGYAGAYLRERPPDVEAALSDAGLDVDEALARVPHTSGDSLAEDLRQARSLFGPHPMDSDLQNRGSFLHNLFVHGLRRR
jgi:hypothetical protein